MLTSGPKPSPHIGITTDGLYRLTRGEEWEILGWGRGKIRVEVRWSPKDNRLRLRTSPGQEECEAASGKSPAMRSFYLTSPSLFAMDSMRSITRFEYPHSLSYQETTLKKLLLS